MSKILVTFLCLALSISLVAALTYDVQIDVGPESFPAVKGSLNILVVQGSDYTMHKLRTTTIRSGVLYVYKVNLDIEVEKITSIIFLWKASDSNVQTPIYLNQLNLIPSYIKDGIARTKARKKLCPLDHQVYSNKQTPLADCKSML